MTIAVSRRQFLVGAGAGETRDHASTPVIDHTNSS